MKHFIVLAVCFLAVLALPAISWAEEDGIQTTAKQAYIIDYDTGVVLYEKNADEQTPTSSMSKVMTMYMVFKALKHGGLSLDTELLVSEKAWRKGGSKMFVPVGKRVKVEDLIRGVVIQSGNDATIVLAEGLSGTESAFVRSMNKEAEALGMVNTHFQNASGWPDPKHYSTARDLAIMTTALIKNFSEYYHYFSEKEFTYSDIRQHNRNPLLRLDIGADGVKTGHTEDGGYGLIGSGLSKDGRRVVMVLNGMESSKERKEEGARLLRWSLETFKMVTLFEDDPVLGQAQLYLGEETVVDLKAKEPVRYVVSKISSDDIRVDIIYNEPLKAPIKAGTEVGTVRIHLPEGVELDVPLITANAVKEAGLFIRTIEKARLLTTKIGRLK